MFNNLSNTTISGTRTANTGSVGTNGRARNAGDAFVDNSQAIIINSTYQPLDANNETRLGTNYGALCGTINCNGHNYGGWGGRHYRGGWGAYYEGAALNGYCSSQGGFGSNGSAYNGNDAFNGCTPLYHDVDMAVFVRNSGDTADAARWTNDSVKDSTNNNNHGIPTNTTVADGFYGKARNFNGATDYVEMADSSSLDLSSTFTWEVWVNPSSILNCGSAGSPACVIFNKESTYQWALNNTGTLEWAITPSWSWVNTGISIPVNQWCLSGSGI